MSTYTPVELRELGRARAAKLDDETEAARAEMLLAAAYAPPRMAEVLMANATDPVPGIWMARADVEILNARGYDAQAIQSSAEQSATDVEVGSQ